MSANCRGEPTATSELRRADRHGQAGYLRGADVTTSPQVVGFTAVNTPTSNELPARRPGTRALCRVRRVAARARHDERGAGYLAAFIVLFSVLVVAGVGILVDSARIFAADRQCTSIAFEAARAGANALHRDAMREGDIVIDAAAAQAAASAAASAFVSEAGATLVSVSIDGDEVTVVVSADVDAWFPLISDRTVSERATVRPANVSD